MQLEERLLLSSPFYPLENSVQASPSPHSGTLGTGMPQQHLEVGKGTKKLVSTML